MATYHEHQTKEDTSGRQEEKNPQVDMILEALHPTGRYQILHMVVLMLSFPAAAFQLFSNVFTARDVPHRCSGPPEGSDWTEIFGNIENLTVIQEKCRVVLTDNSSVIDTAACVYGTEYELSGDASVISQFDLVCGLDWVARFSQTICILGQGIGATLTTFFSDRFGRKIIVVSSNLGLLVCGLIIAFAPNIIIFIIFKFFVGAFQQGVVTIATTYFLELLPYEKRAIPTWATGSIWAFGVTLFSLVSFCFKENSWRILQTVLSLVSASAFFQWWYMDESLRWLMANGKAKDSIKVIKRIATVNKQDGKEILEQVEHSVVQMANTTSQQAQGGSQDIEIKATERLSFFHIFRVKRLLLNSVCMWFAWFTAALSFFTIYLTATSLSGDPYLNFALTALMELPPNIFFFFFLNRLGRRMSLTIMYGVMGAGVLLAGSFKRLETENSAFSICTLLASLVAMFGSSGSFVLIFTYTPEMFPTNLRSQALGVSSFFGRMGGMLAPFAGVLAEQAVWAPGLVLGICACVVCILAQFLPETGGRELPQTISEFEAWFKKDKSQKPLKLKGPKI